MYDRADVALSLPVFVFVFCGVRRAPSPVVCFIDLCVCFWNVLWCVFCLHCCVCSVHIMLRLVRHGVGSVSCCKVFALEQAVLLAAITALLVLHAARC